MGQLKAPTESRNGVDTNSWYTNVL